MNLSTPPAALGAAPTSPLAPALAELTSARTDRATLLSGFRRALSRLQSDTEAAFLRGLSGVAAARRLSHGMDAILVSLHAYTERHVFPLPEPRPAAEQLAVAATGGYGRGVLAPFSDIDLLFLSPWAATPRTEQVVEFILYFLWDLGLKVGHATRSVEECLTHARSDLTIRTNLLDARYLTGEADVFEVFRRRFAEHIRDNSGEFITQKQAERDNRRRKFGDSAYLLEPNIKEGKGGMRDIQTLYWMARATHSISHWHELADPERFDQPPLTLGELRTLRRAIDFLWRVRFHMHYVCGRAEERLTFDLQPVIGARLSYTHHVRTPGVERFMKHYFVTAGEVTRLGRVLEPELERSARGAPAIAPTAPPALMEAGFVLLDGMLTLMPGRSIEDEPILALRMLREARDRGVELHPLSVRALIRDARAGRRARDDREANEIFLDLLSSSHADGALWLRVMNETGFLGRFIPDWGRIVGQMQFDTYHVFTVDEHTIEAVGVLDQVQAGTLVEVAPVASGLMPHIQSKRALYAAMLLHDIAKGRGGDHSELGAEVATRLGPRLGLTAEETETASWLVLHHLVLSQTAFKRDIDDPKTILDIAELVQSPERLRLLLVLTVADMRAVSGKVWNNWKATLLRELYWRVAEVLAGGLNVPERDARVARAREGAAALLSGWTERDLTWFQELGYPSYWLGFDPGTHARHAAMAKAAERNNAELTVETQPLPARGVTEVTVYTLDHPGLFSRIAGALAVAGATIVDARIHTMTNGMALDTFWVQDAAGGAFDAPHRLARLSVLIEQSLSGRLKLEPEIRKATRGPGRLRAIDVPPRVVIDNHASHSHTVVEVNGRDRPGFLHDVTAAISNQGLTIASAHVTTYGVRAVDVFYVKDVFGLKVTNERKLALLRQALLEALEPPEPAPGAVARSAA